MAEMGGPRVLGVNSPWSEGRLCGGEVDPGVSLCGRADVDSGLGGTVLALPRFQSFSWHLGTP